MRPHLPAHLYVGPTNWPGHLLILHRRSSSAWPRQVLTDHRGSEPPGHQPCSLLVWTHGHARPGRMWSPRTGRHRSVTSISVGGKTLDRGVGRGTLVVVR